MAKSIEFARSSSLAAVGLFLSGASAPFGFLAALAGIAVSQVAWNRCARDPSLKGRGLAGVGLALGYAVFVLSLGGFGPYAPSVATRVQFDPIVADSSRALVEGATVLGARKYTVVGRVVANTKSSDYLGVSSGRDGLENLYDQARAAGGDDVINIRSEARVSSYFGGLWADRITTFYGVAIKYNTR